MADLLYSDVACLLKPDFKAGNLFWLPRSLDLFRDGNHTAKHRCYNWNARFAGLPALASVHQKGYRYGRIFRTQYMAHRVLWLLHTGEWPSEQIDHINGDPSDNRIDNLRAVTSAENAKNSCTASNNRSGVTGVCWREREQRWHAQIMGDGRRKHLGVFTDFDTAVAARKAAEIRYGYHENHGRLARCSH